MRYVFLAFTAGTALLLLFNLSAYFGLASDGPFLRGEVHGQMLQHSDTQPMPGGGEYRTYELQAQQLVLLDFAGTQTFYQWRHMLYLLFQNLGWALVVFVFYQMYRIFKNLEAGRTFDEGNTRRIQWIALAVLSYPIVDLGSKLIFRGIVARLEDGGISFSPLALLSEQILLGGVLCIVISSLAAAFRHGAKLQQEQDLTI